MCIHVCNYELREGLIWQVAEEGAVEDMSHLYTALQKVPSAWPAGEAGAAELARACAQMRFGPLEVRRARIPRISDRISYLRSHI